jgi:hypothetical protein
LIKMSLSDEFSSTQRYASAENAMTLVTQSY